MGVLAGHGAMLTGHGVHVGLRGVLRDVLRGGRPLSICCCGCRRGWCCR